MNNRESAPQGALEIDLPGGRRIRGTSLRQDLTYAGVVEGYPRAMIDHLILRGLEQGLGRRTPHYFMIPPPRRDARLPPVLCVARFSCPEGLVREPERASQLTVAWFQEDFGLPPEPVQAELRDLDWEGLAGPAT